MNLLRHDSITCAISDCMGRFNAMTSDEIPAQSALADSTPDFIALWIWTEMRSSAFRSVAPGSPYPTSAIIVVMTGRASLKIPMAPSIACSISFRMSAKLASL
jgi:hypothetical protein